jgi:hypothetical protein
MVVPEQGGPGYESPPPQYLTHVISGPVSAAGLFCVSSW